MELIESRNAEKNRGNHISSRYKYFSKNESEQKSMLRHSVFTIESILEA